jgi:hypothetical protein
MVLESITHFASIGASVAAILSPGAMAFGVVPRAGPLRAAVLGFSSKLAFLRPSYVVSQRPELLDLKENVNKLPERQYIVVSGPKVRRMGEDGCSAAAAANAS